MIDFIEIKGYKSIQSARIELRPVNILIGGNGAGKSNVLSFFEFLNKLYDRKLSQYVALNGGAEKMLYQGSKMTPKLSATLVFKGVNGNGYEFILERGETDFIFTAEYLIYMGKLGWNIAENKNESAIRTTDNFRAKYVKPLLKSFKKYHFHDTGKDSPFNNTSHIENDAYFLYEKGENLAAFLYSISRAHPVVYQRIVRIVQSIAPYFSDFFLQPNEEKHIRLQWQDKYSSMIYGANDLSDGTIRFIALTVLFMQPNLPSTIIIDEPELGLHPVAIAKLAGMIRSVSERGCQVIVATQSTDFIGHFEPEDIITVDLKQGVSVFNRLKKEDLLQWLEEYSLGDLFRQNIIQGGQPN